MQISKYPVKSTTLSNIAEFVWHLTGDSYEDINNELLPVVNTDMIINVASPIFYRFSNEPEACAPATHIRNVKKKVQIIRQQGPVNVWGVSLYPWGACILLKSAMCELEGQVIDLEEYNPDFAACVPARLSSAGDDMKAAHVIEQGLETWLGSAVVTEDIFLLQDFTNNMHSQNISEFCAARGISIKKLERLVKRYIGITPKQLQQIGRFQKTSNQFIYNPSGAVFADLAYSHHYYDQTHFIKDFKTHSGVTPSDFLSKRDSVKEKIK